MAARLIVRAFVAHYVLRNGVRGELHCLATSSCGAVLCALDAFGDRLRACSVRPQC